MVLRESPRGRTNRERKSLSKVEDSDLLGKCSAATGWQGRSLVCWVRASLQSQGKEEATLWGTGEAGNRNLVAGV